MTMIDWSSADTHVLLNPRMPRQESERLERLVHSVSSLPAHLWVATSGTTGAIKLVALSKEAVLASAAAVNRHLDANAGDAWCCVLPEFHVGGLGIYARAHLSGSRVQAQPWDATVFARGGFTLASLVPAQVRDLVRARLHCPRGLRAIVVGGGALAADLEESARELGWPLLASYGLTEAASQVATATAAAAELRVLDHMKVRIEDGHIVIAGPSLLTGYAMFDEEGRASFVDPKVHGWFVTEDRGELHDGALRVQGRGGNFIKIGGESVDLVRLERILESVRGTVDAAVVAVPDERLGAVIHLAADTGDAGDVVEAFNSLVLPFERIRVVRYVEAIPRTPLGKLKRRELEELLR